jgi:hypothetical protein
VLVPSRRRHELGREYLELSVVHLPSAAERLAWVASELAGTEPEARARIEDDLRANHRKTVVATSSLGMGFDEPDVVLGDCIDTICIRGVYWWRPA